MRRLGAAGLIGVLASAALVACSSPSGGTDGTISIVASTNVYGDIVRQLAGRKVEITSIISDPSADPHSYEASTRTQLAISRADLIIENGGGYDDFMDRLRDAAGTEAEVINAVDVSGMKVGKSFNEHVWYDFPTVAKVVDRIVGFLTSHDKKDARTFEANAARVKDRLRAMEADEATIKANAGGDGVAITEPVADYMIEACDLKIRTPVEFSEAVEQGTDVAPRVLQQTLALFDEHQVELFIYNEQTAGPETDQLLGAAEDNNIPAVPVTETLPSGKTYLTWMQGNLDAIAAAEGFSLS